MLKDIMLTIYQYEHAHQFIYDAWQEKKLKNPRFSMRSWAKKLGFKSTSPLSLMLAGKRSISMKYIPSFISDLDLNSEEGFYLESLVAFNKSDKAEDKDFYLKRLEKLHPDNKLEFVQVDMHDFFKDPLHFYILDILEITEIIPNNRWIQSRLYFKYSLLEIEKAIGRLLTYEFIKEMNTGYIKLKNQFTSKVDISSEIVKAFHQNCALKGIEAVGAQEMVDREFGSYVLSFDSSRLEEAKKDLRDFVSKFISKYGEDDYPESVYQINFQFFKAFQLLKEER